MLQSVSSEFSLATSLLVFVSLLQLKRHNHASSCRWESSCQGHNLFLIHCEACEVLLWAILYSEFLLLLKQCSIIWSADVGSVEVWSSSFCFTHSYFCNAAGATAKSSSRSDWLKKWESGWVGIFGCAQSLNWVISSKLWKSMIHIIQISWFPKTLIFLCLPLSNIRSHNQNEFVCSHERFHFFQFHKTEGFLPSTVILCSSAQL